MESANRLLMGDCLEKMKDIPDGSVDLVLTDPPYGTTACKWDSVIPLEPMWEQLKRVIKPNGAIVMTASQPFTTTLIASNLKMFKYCWVWDKKQSTGGVSAKSRPMKAHEDIVVFNGVKYIPQMSEWKPHQIKRMPKKRYTATPKSKMTHATHLVCNKEDKLQRGKYPQSVLRINALGRTSKESGLHPTQKPVALMEYLIKTYTQEGETILDFAMGSGTTGVAAKNLNRNFIGIEKDETYFDIAKERINQ